MLKQSVQIKLGTKLKLTPQLKHSLRILQMSVLDLEQELQSQLESNVMLEREQDETQSLPTLELDEQNKQSAEQELEPASSEQWDDIVTRELDTDYSSSSSNNNHNSIEQRDYADKRSESLAEHLLLQLGLEQSEHSERLLYAHLIDALDENGLLSESLDDIYIFLQNVLPELQKKDLLKALQHLQSCEPAGVAARNLPECLTIQLKRLSIPADLRDLALTITQHLDLLAQNKLKNLRQQCRTSESKLADAIEIVRKLNPRPAASFAQTEALHIIPDVVVKRHRDEWVIEINRANIPNLGITQAYAKSIRGKGNDDLKQQLQEARWLLQGLVMRHETLIKVSQAIVSRQLGFLEHGETAMQPMMMRELAGILSVHESTISRVVANKYMQTPRGTYALRYFFSSQIVNAEGDAHSATAIKGLISEMINAENKAKPLSDNKLAQMLKAQGIPVARRTVAKYREALGLASSSERRV